jgi:two-component sensor histidine kinase
MPDLSAEIATLQRRQAAIAGFGSFALRQNDLMTILSEAARVCAQGLNVPFCKICRYRPQSSDLLVEAGCGWHDGVVGNVVSRADTSTPQGRAFITGQPSICNDLSNDHSFELPGFYADHGIRSTIDVVIKGNGKPYGVLEIDNDKVSEYNDFDIDFLTSFANVLAEAVATSKRTAELNAAIKEKDRLLHQKKTLAEELQHRVRNNMQLVYGMLSKQLDDTPDETGKRGIRSIARRVSTLAQVYDNLLGSDMERTTDFGAYAEALCLNIAEIQATQIKLTCDADSILLDLDTVTALGIILAELVTNSYEHAFPTSEGSITVSIRAPASVPGTATMTVRDDGTGFLPKYESKRHGLGLMQRLVEQVRGAAKVTSDSGAAWEIRFPVSAMRPDMESYSSREDFVSE